VKINQKIQAANPTTPMSVKTAVATTDAGECGATTIWNKEREMIGSMK
jgi:hypothetical protein